MCKDGRFEQHKRGYTSQTNNDCPFHKMQGERKNCRQSQSHEPHFLNSHTFWHQILKQKIWGATWKKFKTYYNYNVYLSQIQTKIVTLHYIFFGSYFGELMPSCNTLEKSDRHHNASNTSNSSRNPDYHSRISIITCMMFCPKKFSMLIFSGGRYQSVHLLDKTKCPPNFHPVSSYYVWKNALQSKSSSQLFLRFFLES